MIELQSRRRKITIIFLLILTVVLAAVSIYVGITISKKNQAPDDSQAGTNNCCGTPGYVNQDCNAGAGMWEQGYYDCLNGNCSACAGGGEACGNGVCRSDKGENTTTCPTDCKSSGGGGSGGTGTTCTPGTVRCKKDNSSVCNGVASPMAGQICQSNGTWPSGITGCVARDACAPDVNVGGGCAGKTRLSCGESSKGAFVGCDGAKNCFCTKAGVNFGTGNLDCGNVPVGTAFDSTYSLNCQADAGNDSCGVPSVAVCGDGIINQATEKCEVGVACATGTCNTSTCTCTTGGGGGGGTTPVCGDKTCNGTEAANNQCEVVSGVATSCKTNTRIGAGTASLCRSNCTWCGDGTLQTGEACEVGHACSTGSCNLSTCTCSTTPQDVCGDSTCSTSEVAANRCEVVNGQAIQCSNNQVIGAGTSTLCRSDCTWCGDGVVQTGEACEPNIPGGPACTTSCQLATNLQCTDMSRVGTDSIGPGEVVLFNVTITGTNNDDPYAQSQVRLRVSSTANDTAVGRDQTNASNALVSAYAMSSNESSGESVAEMRATYYFAWEAVNVDNSNLTNGNYDVEVSFDGGTTWSSVAACRDQITFSTTEPVEPTFSIVKTGSSVCSTSTGADLTYTITLTNLGPGQGTVDYVEDVLDSEVRDSWVSAITSSRSISGVVNDGRIRWTGTADQRTYDENETATFSYTVSIPASYLGNFSDGVSNVVTAVNGDNQVRFNHYMQTGCRGTLPPTGIMDTTPWIFGIMAVVVGLIALRLKVGQEALMPIIEDTKLKTSSVFTSAASKLGFGEVIRKKRKKKIEKNF